MRSTHVTHKNRRTILIGMAVAILLFPAWIAETHLVDWAVSAELDDNAFQATQLDSMTLIYNDVSAAEFPKIISLVTVTNDAGFVIGELDENNFEVREDNTRELPILVEELTSNEIGFSVILTLDRSGSMRGLPIEDSKTAASAFVNLMQGEDQSAIVSFSHQPQTDSDFTTVKDTLTAAINRMEAMGGTAIFDALIHSVYLFTSSIKNRAIILMTDGADKDSQYSYAEALTAVLSHEIRVFTIGLGLNPNSPEENILKDLAEQTGGLYYYSPSSSDLEEIYRAISKLLHHRYRITYTTHNAKKDGTRRYVRIDVQLNTNTSADTASYIAPLEDVPIDPPVDPPVDPPDPPVDTPDPPDDPEQPPDEPEVEVTPNPFTPNDDGINDWVEFKKGDTTPTNWVISIMNRTGLEIKTLSNGENYWNGRDAAGNLMLPGCYLYMISDGNQVLHRGLLNLIR